MSNPKPTLKTVIVKAVGLHTKGMRTSMPGRVESYSTATKMASVQPLLLEGDTSEQGDRTTTRLPVINNVPIIFPGSGGVRIKWPIKVGDYVWLNFCCRSIDRWLAQGGEVDPEDDRQHAIDDAVAFCIHNPASPNDATPMIEFTDTTILAGGSNALALKSDVQGLIDAISHAAVVAGDGGAALKANIAAYLTTNGIPAGTIVLKGA